MTPSLELPHTYSWVSIIAPHVTDEETESTKHTLKAVEKKKKKKKKNPGLLTTSPAFFLVYDKCSNLMRFFCITV